MYYLRTIPLIFSISLFYMTVIGQSGTICNELRDCSLDGPPLDDVCPGGSTGDAIFNLSQSQNGELTIDYVLTRGGWSCPGGSTQAGHVQMNVSDGITVVTFANTGTGPGGSPGSQSSGTRVIPNVRANQPLDIIFSGTGDFSVYTSFEPSELSSDLEPNDEIEDVIEIVEGEVYEGLLNYGTSGALRDMQDCYFIEFVEPGDYQLVFDSLAQCHQTVLTGAANLNTGLSIIDINCITPNEKLSICMRRQQSCGTSIMGYRFSIVRKDSITYRDISLSLGNNPISIIGTFGTNGLNSCSTTLVDESNGVELQRSNCVGPLVRYQDYIRDDSPFIASYSGVESNCDWKYLLRIDSCGSQGLHYIPLQAYSQVFNLIATLDPIFENSCISDEMMICNWMERMGNQEINTSDDVLHGLMKVWLVQQYTRHIINRPETNLLIDNFVDFYTQVINNIFSIEQFLDNHIFEFDKAADWENFIGLIQSLFDSILSNSDLSGTQSYILSKQFNVLTSLESQDFGSSIFEGFVKDGFNAALTELGELVKQQLKSNLKNQILLGVDKACSDITPDVNENIETLYAQYLASTDSEMSELISDINFANNFYATIFAEITSGFDEVASAIENGTSFAPILRSWALAIRLLNTTNYVATSAILNTTLLDAYNLVNVLPQNMLSNGTSTSVIDPMVGYNKSNANNPYISDVLSFNNTISVLQNLASSQDSTGIVNYREIFELEERNNLEDLFKLRSDYLVLADELLNVDQQYTDLFYEVEIRNSLYNVRKALVYENIFSIMNSNTDEYLELQNNLDTLSSELDSIIFYHDQIDDLIQNHMFSPEPHLIVLNSKALQVEQNQVDLEVEVMNIGTLTSQIDSFQLHTRGDILFDSDSIQQLPTINPKSKTKIEFKLTLPAIDTNYILPYFMEFIGNNINESSYKMGYSPIIGSDEYTCVTDLVLTHDLQIDSTYSVHRQISSNSVVASGVQVEFLAGATICLDNGFEVELNTIFESRIELCEN